MYFSQLTRKLLLLLGIASWLNGCASQDPTTGATSVSGQVVEGQTQKPVGGAAVQVYHTSTGGGYVSVGIAYPTDAQGRFNFSFEADSKTGYLVRATAPPGYLTDWGLAPNLTAGRKNEGVIIPMMAPAWVRLQLVDELPKNRVVIHTQGYEGPGDTFYYPRDTTLIRPCFAGFSSKVFWFITDEKGAYSSYHKDLQFKGLDTLTVRIPF